MRRAALAFALCLAAAGCDRAPSRECEPGESRACACPGSRGTRVCETRGTLGECVCPEPAAAAEPRERARPAAADRGGEPLRLAATGLTSLPPPRTSGGMPLRDALAARRSTRAYAPEPLPAQLLSDLLWAASGVNRPEAGKLTAPTARNRQEIAVYVVLAEGAFVYRPAAHALEAVRSGDLRAATGTQPYVGGAPVNLVYVADTTLMAGADREDLLRTIGADAAYVSENVYLFCASEGLATVVRGSVDREALAAALGLGEGREIVLAQTVGWPAGQGE